MRATAAALLLLAGGCAHRDEVGLLPGEAGAPAGSVVVLDPATGAEIGVIDQADSRAKVSARRVAVRQSKKPLDTRYRNVLGAMPELPRPFTLYFRLGTTDLVEESRAQLPAIFAEISRRPGADVEIVGHTDTTGPGEANDALALRRARETADLLAGMGLDLSITSLAGRGERDLKVETADEVSSAVNRRVELLVR